MQHVGWVRIALVTLVTLAGCRIGFDDVLRPPGDGPVTGGPPDGPPDDPTMIRLLITSDEYGSERAGTPIPGATVLIDRGGGLERLVSDAAGVAQVAAAGVIACHVVLKAELGWRVYSLLAPPGGTIQLGGRPAPSLNHGMTFSVPSNGSPGYTVRVAERCAYPPEFGGTTQLAISYSAACEGLSGRAIAFSQNAQGADVYIDAGAVTFADGSTHAVTGAYKALPAHAVAITGLPGNASDVLAEILDRSGIDLVPLTRSFDSATPQAGKATVNTTAAPGGNTLRIQTTNALPIQYSSTSEIIAPATIAGTIAFDARGMVPLFQSMVLTRPPQVSWTGSGSGGTILIVETITGQVQWDAYLPPSATSVDFPAIPADLGVPTPRSFDFAQVTKLDIPGATIAELTRTIDRVWSEAPYDPMVFPPAGSASARIVYSVGLGPP